MAANCHTDGYTGDTWCLGCGNKIADGENTGKDMTKHDGGTKTESRNATGATCVTPGSYDSVVICLGCGKDLSTTHMEGVTDPNTHEGTTRTENEDYVAGTCMAEATWNEVVYCTACNRPVSTTPKTGEKDMTNHVGDEDRRR